MWKIRSLFSFFFWGGGAGGWREVVVIKKLQKAKKERETFDITLMISGKNCRVWRRVFTGQKPSLIISTQHPKAVRFSSEWSLVNISRHGLTENFSLSTKLSDCQLSITMKSSSKHHTDQIITV